MVRPSPSSTAGPPRWPFCPGVGTSPRKVTFPCIIHRHRIPPVVQCPRVTDLKGCGGRGWETLQCSWGGGGGGGCHFQPPALPGASEWLEQAAEMSRKEAHRPHLRLLAQTRQMVHGGRDSPNNCLAFRSLTGPPAPTTGSAWQGAGWKVQESVEQREGPPWAPNPRDGVA